MAGFRITYDGSLLGRTDVPQVTGTSNSLTQTIVTSYPPSPSGTGWEGEGIFSPDLGLHGLFGQSNLPPSTGTYGIYGVDQPSGTILTAPVIQSSAGGITTLSSTGLDFQIFTTTFYGRQAYIVTPLLTGTFNLSVRVVNHDPTREFRTGKYSPAGTYITGFVGGDILNTPSGVRTINISVTLANEFLGFFISQLDSVFGTFNFCEIDYIRLTQTSGTSVSVLDSTITGGAAPTGGTGTTATPSTVIEGAAGTAGPAKNFGAIVEHNGSQILEAKYQPSADSTQNAKASIADRKIITAAATDIVVKGEGLDATDTLGSSDTSIIVKDYKDATEN